ncbi:hypothetical protein WR25_19792 [Diploscapter pachys]|uniref:Peptidase S1 domain-containing protein n=1 Tax=Diploscapter pachys TaxID=2018661 RepID=A0A2A2JDZ3_9BILA|nr:hypothetical protein WR25_19792 [Diploscapter pachys]
MDVIFQAEKRCTGSFISPKHVITAAHCFIEEKSCYKEYVYKGNISEVFTNEGYTVHYGTHCVKIRDSGKCPNYQGKSIAIKHVIIPKSYVLSNCGLGDIAIAELASEIDIAKNHLDTVCLPHANTTAAQLIVGAGFGMDPHDPYAAQKHLEAAEFCKMQFCSPTVKAGNDTFCVLERKSFMCGGDSGGAIIQNANKHSDMAVAVLSKGPDFGKWVGSVVTSTRLYAEFICHHTGVCADGIQMETDKRLYHPQPLILK